MQKVWEIFVVIPNLKNSIVLLGEFKSHDICNCSFCPFKTRLCELASIYLLKQQQITFCLQPHPGFHTEYYRQAVCYELDIGGR